MAVKSVGMVRLLLLFFLFLVLWFLCFPQFRPVFASATPQPFRWTLPSGDVTAEALLWHGRFRCTNGMRPFRAASGMECIILRPLYNRNLGARVLCAGNNDESGVYPQIRIRLLPLPTVWDESRDPAGITLNLGRIVRCWEYRGGILEP